MSSVQRVVIGVLALVGLLLAGAAAAPVANAHERTVRAFVVPLSAKSEVPECEAGLQSGARGVALILINEDTGRITYRVLAKNLPAPIEGSPGAHIHVQDPASPTGLTGPIVVHFDRTGRNTGLVAAGTTESADAAAILANPENYYVNVHTTDCPAGTIRGQLA
jgi:hypothetical protein